MTDSAKTAEDIGELRGRQAAVEKQIDTGLLRISKEMRDGFNNILSKLDSKASIADVVRLEKIIEQQRIELEEVKQEVRNNREGRLTWDAKTKAYAVIIFFLGTAAMNILYQYTQTLFK